MMMKSLNEYFLSCVNSYPDELFLYDEEHRLTYQEALKETIRLGNRLTSFGVKAGDPVCFRAVRSLEGVSFFFALLGIGALASLADPHQKAKEFVMDAQVDLAPSFYLTNESGRWVISDAFGREEEIDPWDPKAGEKPLFAGPKDPEDPVILCFTSGSTNRSKGVLMSSRALLAHIELFHDHAGYSLCKKAISMLPMYHVFGFAQFLALAYYGGSMYFPASLEAEFLAKKINEHSIDRFDAVPAFHGYFAKERLAKGFTTPTLKIGITSGAYLPPERFLELEKISGVRLIPVYGQSECLTISGFQDQADSSKHPYSIGKFLKGSQGKIVKEDGSEAAVGEKGEIIVKSPQQMNGYLNREESPIDEDGYLHSGDLGYLDEEGYLYFVGRIKDMVIKNGINISCPFLERVIGGLPYVEDVAVTAIESATRGERILCACVLNEEGVGEERLREDLKGLLHKNEVPDRFLFLDALPRKHNLKIDKAEIRALYQRTKKR